MLNQVERWLGLLTDKLIRRGVHTVVAGLAVVGFAAVLVALDGGGVGVRVGGGVAASGDRRLAPEFCSDELPEQDHAGPPRGFAVHRLGVARMVATDLLVTAD
ncbi:hypothetical protein ABZ622_39710 [Streptomyces sp. NPDC007164]|uniref:hypothetical protein n=1 Tax=Streptomyces sp. NPDC007164 TaxID=3156918 RepID=UPI003407FED2